MMREGMQSGEMLALAGGRLIDGTGHDPSDDAVVLVEGQSIRDAGPKGQVEIPAGWQTLDVSGMTVLPGMIDCHCHVSLTTLDIEKRLLTPPTVEMFQTAAMMERTLRAGITTIREPGMLNDVGFKVAQEQGLIQGPRLVLAGGLGQTGGHFDEYYPRGMQVPLFGVEIADGPEAVRQAARRILRQGFDFIKICTTGGVASPADSPDDTEWSPEELDIIVYEAQARGKAVMAHAQGARGIKNAVGAGVWSIEHGSLMDEEALAMLAESGTYLVPTLLVMDDLVEHGAEMGLTPLSLAKIDRVKDRHIESFRKAVDAGVKIGMGTDVFYAGSHGRNARELELMVEYGMAPMEAIVAATKGAAEVCRVADEVGTLEPGKCADLLVVDGNPLEDISLLQDSSRLRVVMQGGKRLVDTLGSGRTR